MQLKRARTIANITQDELARRVGVTQTQVSFWESGQATPHPRNRAKVERILGPVDWPGLVDNSPLNPAEREEVELMVNIMGRFVGKATAQHVFNSMEPDQIRRFFQMTKQNLDTHKENPEPLLPADMERFK